MTSFDLTQRDAKGTCSGGARFGLACLAVVLVSEAGAAEVLASASARWGSSSSTFEQQSVSGITLGLNDTTGVLAVDSGAIQAAGVATSTLASNSIGAASAWAGTSVLTTPNSGPVRTTFATGRIEFDDTLLVESAILPDGTPVQISFALAVAGSLSASHSLAQGGQRNQARSVLSVQGSVTPVGGSVSTSEFISDSDNVAFLGTDGSILSNAVGLLDPGTPTLNFNIDTEVGATLRFIIRLTADVFGGASPASQGPFDPLENQNGAASAQLGLAFGATAGNGQVQLASELYAGAFPLASQATVANALLGQPASPVVIPLPPALYLFATALAGLLSRGWRRADG